MDSGMPHHLLAQWDGPYTQTWGCSAVIRCVASSKLRDICTAWSSAYIPPLRVAAAPLDLRTMMHLTPGTSSMKRTCFALCKKGLLVGQLLLELSILLHQLARLLPPHTTGQALAAEVSAADALTALPPTEQQAACYLLTQCYLCAQLLFVLLQSHVDLRSLAPLLRRHPTPSAAHTLSVVRTEQHQGFVSRVRQQITL